MLAQADADAPRQPFATGDSGGVLRTLGHGIYQCALPGDATGRAFEPVPEESFSIGPGSSYRAETGSGIYLMRGDTVTFTRGPKKGERFEQTGQSTLVKLGPEGDRTRLTCTRLPSSR
jgi:hypothetical protein